MTWQCLECGAANPPASAQCGSRTCQQHRVAALGAGPGAGVSSKASKTPTPKPRQRKQHSYTPEFNEFWSIYMAIRNKDKHAASLAYARAVRIAPHGVICAGAKRYAEESASEAVRFRKHAATWLNGRCWDDGTDAEAKVKGAYDHLAEVGSDEWIAQREAEEQRAMQA